MEIRVHTQTHSVNTDLKVPFDLEAFRNCSSVRGLAEYQMDKLLLLYVIELPFSVICPTICYVTLTAINANSNNASEFCSFI